LIKDTYVQLNTQFARQFVLSAEDESHNLSNVSTFLGNFGLLLKSRLTGSESQGQEEAAFAHPADATTRVLFTSALIQSSWALLLSYYKAVAFYIM